jgi:tetratricopeptide (TPR) repeat protein
LLTGSLFQRAEQVCEPLVRATAMTADIKELRDRILPDLEKVVKYDEKFGPAHLLLAELYSLDGDQIQQTRQAVDRAIECLKDDPRRLASAYVLRSHTQEDVQLQLADCTRAVELDPSNPEVWQARALSYLRQNETQKAIDDFNSLIELDPESLPVRLAVAETLAQIAQYDEALKHINLTIDKQPTAAAYMLRARLRVQQEKLTEAIQDLDEAVKLAPTEALPLLMRAQLYVDEGRNALALQDVDRVLEMRPGVPAVRQMRREILAAMGNFTDALRDVEEQLLKDPDDLGLKLELAIYLNAAEQSADAVKVYSDVLKVDPQNGAALRGRGDAYLNIGDHPKAVADYEVAVQLFPEDSGLLNNFAWVLATSPEDSLRNGKRAVELGLKACELTEYKQSHILSTLAAAYAETGDFESAVKWSEKSVELGEGEIKEQLQHELESYRQKKPWREKKTEPAPAAGPGIGS